MASLTVMVTLSMAWLDAAAAPKRFSFACDLCVKNAAPVMKTVASLESQIWHRSLMNSFCMRLLRTSPTCGSSVFSGSK